MQDESDDVDHRGDLVSAISKLAIFDLLKRSKVVSHGNGRLIVKYLLDDGIGVESDAVIVLDCSKPFVGNLNLASSHHVSFTLLDGLIEFASCILEECRLDHASLDIHKIHI